MINFQTWLLCLIPGLPLAGFVLNSIIALSRSRRGKTGSEWLPSLIGCVLPVTAFLISAWAFFTLKASGAENPQLTHSLFTWMATGLFRADFAVLFDSLSAVMALVVTGVGSLIHIYSIGYMKGDSGFARYFSYLNLFLFFMLVLVLGDNLLFLFVGWEGVGLCSYLLIGFWFTDAHKAYCGKKAFVVNRIGDFGFLIGLFLILYAFISQSQSSDSSFFNYSFMSAHKEIFAPIVVAITLFLFMGATGKSAQIPLYVWLPDAMAGPTPVSALIHAATMVTAGVYMVARMYFLYEMAPFTLEVIAGIGVATALISALIACTQYDIKKVLAYSTVSQLGFMFLALGVHAPAAGIFHLVTHAFFKACLFMCAGSVIVALHHEQDIRKMGGLMKKLPATGIAFLISTMAIAGIPPFSGFFSKDEILWNTYLHAPLPIYILVLFVAGLTAFYMFRLFVYVFLGNLRHGHVNRTPWVMDIPVLILAVLAVFGGLLNIPTVLGGHSYLHSWLSGAAHQVELHIGMHSVELQLMVLSAGWAIFMSVVAVILYKHNLDWALKLKSVLKGLYQLISNKFYVDEIYDASVITPLRKCSESLLWKGSDQKLIDGVLVHGWANMAGFMARAVSRVQTGMLGHYLLYLWVALALLLVIAVV